MMDNQDRLFVRHFFPDANHSAALVLYAGEQIQETWLGSVFQLLFHILLSLA